MPDFNASRSLSGAPTFVFVEAGEEAGPTEGATQMSTVTRTSGPLTGRRNYADPRISIVVPALNEAMNLSVILPQLPKVHEVILVDGGSIDGTVEAARRALPNIVTVLQTRRGKGNALAAGFARVTGDIVVMFDADGSADPAEIPAFVKALTDGADFAKGSRFTEGGGSADITPIRRLGNGFLNLLFNAGFGTRYSDLCYGYNAFWADMIPVLGLPDHAAPAPEAGRMVWGDGFEIETVINCRFAAAGVRITEVPSVEKLRMFGESNLHAVKDGLRVLRTLLTEWRRRAAGRRSQRAFVIGLADVETTETVMARALAA
jgi:glycosyltransferase involved in cell wall biosynthesis